MAMLPFCGYNVGDYFAHWLKLGAQADADKLPKIFYVNWFRKADDGHFMWPGFGENSRVLEWVFRRCDGDGEAVETPIGFVPAPGSLNVDGLEIDDADLEALLTVDEAAVAAEIDQVRGHLDSIGDSLPGTLRDELSALEQRLAG
jgi:phosphoenolpyruvate carboxykinase (GTP)